ncbi:uncharacterized protein LOC125655823 [Ostrea edulis]|uniref:uncharacterized protein LOC125655823 n=1 Tax=Ostrea edulis TaxID=37623 RepID=UPI0020943CE1|nr:uncharacterized protein LOC125655823 [Ostrea edulis]XP_048742298.1 uncharacterized protein LOC125655823 [Ostrea edulis]XP_048742301.1 uncharacterized protein LOC125655823 [Ostrea edulis]
MWRIQHTQLLMVLVACWFTCVVCDSDDFDSEFDSSFTEVRNTAISITSIVGIIIGLIFLSIIIVIVVVCCCMRGRRSSGHVYRQPVNQMVVTTATQQPYPATQQPYPATQQPYPATQQPYPGQYFSPQPYNQYQPVQSPPHGYVQHPPPAQGGYPPVQQAPPLTGSGYPPQETKAQPTAPPADDVYPLYPANPQQPPPYPGN